jgi:hypothetical protein
VGQTKLPKAGKYLLERIMPYSDKPIMLIGYKPFML